MDMRLDDEFDQDRINAALPVVSLDSHILILLYQL